MKDANFSPQIVYVHSGRFEPPADIPFRTTMFYEVELIDESWDGWEERPDGRMDLRPSTIHVRRPGTVVRPHGGYRYFAIVFDAIHDSAYEEKYRVRHLAVNNYVENTGLFSPSTHYSEILDSLPEEIPVENPGKYLEHFSNAFLYFLSREKSAQVFIQNELLCILTMLLKELDGKGKRKCHNQGKMLQKAKDYIDLHYSEKITLEELADETALCREYFCRRFKQEYGFSPMEYLFSVRLHQAQFLLANTDKTISKIVTECGFANDSYFYRVFRNAVGISPAEFRKQMNSVKE